MALNNIPTSISSRRNRKHNVKFVSTPKDSLICDNCKHILVPPVSQTQCGHRICQPCMDLIFMDDKGAPKDGISVSCPGQEDDCFSLQFQMLIPDRATTKELSRLLVYCTNKDDGCTEEVKWNNLGHHEENCKFKTEHCPNAECNEKCLMKDLELHMLECAYTPVLCDTCDSVIARHHIKNGHKKECVEKIRPCPLSTLGCGFQGTCSQLQEHAPVQTVPHTKQIVKEISDAKGIQNGLTSQMGAMNDTILSIQREFNQKRESTKADFEDMQQMISSLEEQLCALKAMLNKNVTKEDFEQEISKMRDITESSKRQEQRLQQLENGPASNRNQEGLNEKIQQMASSVEMHDKRIAESDLRFRLLETASFDGRLIWKIPNYTRRKRDAIEGRTLSLYSQPFYSSYHGYKMCARAYLNGDGLGKGTHLSLFFVLMRGEYDALLSWPFRQKVTLALLDQSGGRKHISDAFRPDPTSSSFRKPVGELNIASGSPMFAQHEKIENEPYLKDDTLYICVSIDMTDMADIFS